MFFELGKYWLLNACLVEDGLLEISYIILMLLLAAENLSVQCNQNVHVLLNQLLMSQSFIKLVRRLQTVGQSINLSVKQSFKSVH